MLDKPFNCIQTVAIIMCKQISSNSFKNKMTNKLFNYKSYIYIYIYIYITIIIIIIIIIIISSSSSSSSSSIVFSSREFSTPALAVGISVEFGKQVSSGLPDSSDYSSRSHQCCSLDGLDYPSDFQSLQSFFQTFWNRSKNTNYN